MSCTPEVAGAGAPARTRVNVYAMAWRWHAWAGLLVLPFLLTLALTGAVMVFFTGFQTRLGAHPSVEPLPVALAVGTQARAALSAIPGGTLRTYIAPREADRAAWFVVGRGEVTFAVAIDPYRGRVLRTVDKDHTPFAWAERIHGTLLMGDLGDRLIEIVAWAALVMLLTGVVLWWPRGAQTWGSRWRVVRPGKGGLAGWRSLHAALGAWLALLLAVFLITGLTWTGVTGAQWLQAWGSFPAEKWDAVPTSIPTHAALNTAGLQEVPWGLAQTPLPVSGSPAGVAGVPAGTPVDLDSVAALALRLGFAGQHQIAVPQSEEGVFTLSADTMSGDLERPTGDRTVHVDRHSGRVLVDLGFADYNALAKTMAVAVALHQGDLGVWNALLNLVACLGVVLMCVAGVMMWWKRRPVR